MAYNFKCWSRGTSVQEIEFDGGHMEFSIESMDKRSDTVCFHMSNPESIIEFKLDREQITEVINHLTMQLTNQNA